jgi:hypothetical protein
MATLTITKRKKNKTTKRVFKKNILTDSKGRKHCKTCGAFISIKGKKN